MNDVKNHNNESIWDLFSMETYRIPFFSVFFFVRWCLELQKKKKTKKKYKWKMGKLLNSIRFFVRNAIFIHSEGVVVITIHEFSVFLGLRQQTLAQRLPKYFP